MSVTLFFVRFPPRWSPPDRFYHTPSSPILEENGTLFECYDLIQKTNDDFWSSFGVPPQQFCVSFHFYLFHVSPHREYSFPLQMFVGYCLCCLFFPCLPSTCAIKPGSIDGPEDRAVARPPHCPSHNCGDRSRPVVWSLSIFNIFGHDHHSGHACGVADDDDEQGARPRALQSSDNWAGAGGILSYGD